MRLLCQLSAHVPGRVRIPNSVSKALPLRAVARDRVSEATWRDTAVGAQRREQKTPIGLNRIKNEISAEYLKFEADSDRIQCRRALRLR